MRRPTIHLLLVVVSACATPFSLTLAQDFAPYYPEEMRSELQMPRGETEAIKSMLHRLLTYGHMKHDGQADTIEINCKGKGECVTQKSLDYSTARKYLFGSIHLDASNSINEVYCDKRVTRGVGPMRIPSATVVNCEHTWPQSKFTSQFSKETQKGDLHHLFPTDPVANSTRSNHPFADVNGDEVQNCTGSYIGHAQNDGSGDTFFEPPAHHKGNVARALFYFSVRYKLSISPVQEAYLRQWNESDPVDADEMERNNQIEKIQGNRNPFIDFPQLVKAISDF